jgi:integrase
MDPNPLMFVNGNVPPRRVANAARRPREYLTADEVERLMTAARSRPGRYGQRDATMILLAYRHGLRVSELVGLRWDMLDLAQGHLHVQRLKNGRPSVHTVRGTELRALRRLQREQAPPSPYLFTTERRDPDERRRVQKAARGDRGGGRTPLPRPPAHAAPCLRLRPRPWPA